MGAVCNGQTEAVKLLLEKCTDPNLQTTDGSTALIWAAGKGQTEVVKLLLQKGANANLRDAHRFR
jgi:ankyrin repeat protein